MTQGLKFTAILLLVLGSTLASAEQNLTYKRYVNVRFGYGISYPEVLIPQGEADNGDGQRFLTGERDVEMAVWGRNNVLDETLQSEFREESKDHSRDHPDRRVTYKHLESKWFVVSGFEKGKIFYQKTLYEGSVFYTYYIAYPQSKKKMWDRIAAAIATSFKYLGEPQPAMP